MFDLLTSKNKNSLFAYLLFAVPIIICFAIIVFIGKASLSGYKNIILKDIDSAGQSITQPIAQLKPITPNVVLIIIDGLSNFDAEKLEFLKNLKNTAAFSSFEAQSPTLSLCSWSIFLTGSSADEQGIFFPKALTEMKVGLFSNIISIASKYGLKTAIFGHKYWESLAGSFADFKYFEDFLISNSNIMKIDENVLAAAYECLLNNKPNLSIIHLPGLDKTSHLFGRGSAEFKMHTEKISAMLESFFKSGIIDNSCVFLAADHGHIQTGGHGGSEPEVRTVPIYVIDKNVNKNSLRNYKVNHKDIAPLISAVLGIPFPLFNHGTFITELFKIDIARKIEIMEKLIEQKSLFYAKYNFYAGFKDIKLFNYKAIIEDINKFPGESRDSSEILAALKTYESRLDLEFINIKDSIVSADRLYRLFIAAPLIALLFIYLIYISGRTFYIFNAIMQVFLFYLLYYSIYFYHGFSFSLSDFNFAENLGPFIADRRIEIIIAYLLSFIPIMSNYFLIQKSLKTWQNYVFYPVFIKFNIYLVFTLVCQCLYYIVLYGIKMTYIVPDMNMAVKYYLDFNLMVTTQAAAVVIFFASYFFLKTFAGKKLFAD